MPHHVAFPDVLTTSAYVYVTGNGLQILKVL